MNLVVWPERISLKYWSSCLVSDFKHENLPILQNENDFEKWGTLIAGSGVFARAGVPTPSIIKTGPKDEKWIKWAKIVYTLMSDEYNIALTTQIN